MKKWHKDTSWDKLDRSNNCAAICNLDNSEQETVTPISADDRPNVNAFIEPDKSSPSLKLVESTPVTGNDGNIDDAEPKLANLNCN